MILELLFLLKLRSDLIGDDEEEIVLLDEVEVNLSEDDAVQETAPVRTDETFKYEAILEKDLAEEKTIPEVEDEDEDDVEGDNDNPDLTEAISQDEEKDDVKEAGYVDL